MNIIWAVIALLTLGGVAALVGWIQGRIREAKIARGEQVEEEPERPVSAGGCCGMHMTCERDSLLSAVSTRIVYFDDEELDRFRGVAGSDYSADAVDEFREILITLRQDDVAGWVRSLQLRQIELPEELKPEVFLVVGECRAYHMEHGPGEHDHHQRY
ncbi:MAG: phospholipase [Porphyromonadaceae bacterium]|nr:phospholipase [Porphyromonadaceae bacterium]